ncbi:MAG TPA: phosphodiester glycosidase family protein [Vicinamibacterales bacterium]
MRYPGSIAAGLVLAVLAVQPAATSQDQALNLTPTEPLGLGVSFYQLDDPAHLGPDAPISARLLEIQSRDARLDVELGKDGTQGRDTVLSMAERRGALAAVNAGFFGTTGDPAGLFKINGLLVSDMARPRGAVAFTRPEGPPLIFDKVTAAARLRAGRVTVPVTGIDTARGARGVIVYTPRYGAGTRTTGDGIEWTLAGRPLRVTAIRKSEASPIPAGGFVISASGAIPDALARLRVRDRVDVAFTYATSLGTSPAAWQRADDIVSGAGLLIWRGRAVSDWTREQLSMQGFVNARHPRTLIGRDRDGDTWLVVVDGRRPGHSVGMSLPELTALSRRLGLVDALNLDGGGSSTMVVKGKVVNRPSDPLGPRPVSDAIVVLRK